MPNRVRLAEPGRQRVVEAIVQDAYQPWVAIVGGRPAPLDADYGALIAAGRVYVTGEPEPVGVLVLTAEATTLLVENVAVRPSSQGRGIGRQLLAFAEARARELGLNQVRLFTHEKMVRNLRFYAELGYDVTGVEMIVGGRLVHLAKPLGPDAGAQDQRRAAPDGD